MVGGNGLEAAPTATTLSASAGATSVLCAALYPSLPAELTTRMPFFAAISAPMVTGVLSPFISLYEWLFRESKGKVV